jgi:hypothetical protein
VEYFIVIWDIEGTRIHGPYSERDAALEWIKDNREENVTYGLTQLPVEIIADKA